jgi:DNA-binding NarL/FixJ family response regulator
MDYITAAEAAERWGVSTRQVQRLLSCGRVQGTQQFGKRMLIPANAKKPEDLRHRGNPQEPRESQKPQEQQEQQTQQRKQRQQKAGPFDDFEEVIGATYVLWPSDDPDSIVGRIPNERLRVLPEMSLAYLRGGFEQVVRRHAGIADNGTVKLHASHTAMAAAINLGDYQLFQKLEGYFKRVASDANANSGVVAYAELALASAYISAAAPDAAASWLKDGDFSALPWVVRQAATFVRCRFFQWKKNFEALLATAQTAIGMRTTDPGVSFYDAYMQQIAAAACYAMGRVADAEEYLLAAMDGSLRHGFVTPLADGIHTCGGLIERLLERKYPEHLDAVVGQAQRTAPNWIAFHNRFTKDSITQVLSIRDYQIARLAAQGVPNKAIAEHFHISPGTLGNRLQIIYEKLFISGKSPKKQLGKFVL